MNGGCCAVVCAIRQRNRGQYVLNNAQPWQDYRRHTFFFEHSESRQTDIHRNTYCFFFAPCSHITGGRRSADLPEGETTSSRNVLASVPDQTALFNKIRFLSLKCSQFLKTMACRDRRRDKARWKQLHSSPSLHVAISASWLFPPLWPQHSLLIQPRYKKISSVHFLCPQSSRPNTYFNYECKAQIILSTITKTIVAEKSESGRQL